MSNLIWRWSILHLSSDLRALISSNTEKDTDSSNNAALFRLHWDSGREDVFIHVLGAVCSWSLVRKLMSHRHLKGVIWARACMKFSCIEQEDETRSIRPAQRSIWRDIYCISAVRLWGNGTGLVISDLQSQSCNLSAHVNDLIFQL